MDIVRKRREALEEMKKLLATQIKVDIAQAIRHHPHLEGQASTRAWDTLANDQTVDALVEELAREEVADAVTRGELPAAAFLHLAGFRPNRHAEG